MSNATTIAVISQGGEGLKLAQALQSAGATVIVFDPQLAANTAAASGVPLAESIADAVRDADVVLSLNSATASLKIAKDVLPNLKSGALFADLNTSTPTLKQRLSALFDDGVFVDVSLMKPVSSDQSDALKDIPVGASGTGAKRFVELMKPYLPGLAYVSKKPGDAAARKLIASLLAKGMAAVAMDALWAAEAMGIEKWTYDEIKREFNEMSEETLDRALTGTIRHVKRRQIEMNDINEMLNDADYMSTTIPGIELTYNRVIHSIKVPFSTSGVMWRDND